MLKNVFDKTIDQLTLEESILVNVMVPDLFFNMGLLSRFEKDKSLSVKEFKEEEHPRAPKGTEHGGQFVAKSDTETVPVTHEKKGERQTEKGKVVLKKWASENKGKLLATTATAVLVFAPIKVGSRLIRMFYSKNSKKLVDFTKLTKSERSAFLRQAEPGDVFLQSAEGIENFPTLLKETAKAIKKNINEVPWAVQDEIGKAIDNVEYPHSALVVGHYDKKFHEELFKTITEDIKGVGKELRPAKTKQEMAKHVIRHSYGLDPGDKEGMLKLNARLLTKEGKEEAWNKLGGRLILVIASTDPKHKGTLRLVTSDMPLGGGCGAFLRTKLPLEKRKEMCNKIFNAYFTRTPTNPKIQFAVDANRKPTSKKNLDIMLRNIFYPFFEPFKGKFSEKVLWKDDAMVCHGAVAALYEQFGGVKLGKEFRYITARDLIEDKKFASLILEAKKKRIYEREDWKPAEEVIKRNRFASPKQVAAGAGTLAVGVGSTIATQEAMYKKSLSQFATKAMTAQKFKEEEHPRAPEGSERGGEFVSKNEPVPEAGRWGGTRKNAGRTAKNPVIAAQNLERRFKEENPDISNEELKKKMIDFAVEKRNTDLHLYLTDPVTFQKRQEENIMDAINSRAGEQKVGKNRIKKVDTSDETARVSNSILTSKAAWDKKVQQSEDVKEAYKTFVSSGEADELETSKAKLITTTAAIATVIGLGILYAKRPHLRKSGFTSTPGETWARPFSAADTYDVMGRDKDTLLRWFRAQDLGPGFHEVEELAKLKEGIVNARQVGAIRSLMGRAAAKVGKVDKDTGEKLYPFLGPKLIGMGPGTLYEPKRYEVFATARNYAPKAGDVEVISGRQLVYDMKYRKVDGKRVGSKVGIDYVALAMGTKRLPVDPDDWGKAEGIWAKYKKLPDGLDVAETAEGKKIWQLKKEKSSIRKDESSPYVGTAKEEESGSEEKLVRWLSRVDNSSPSPQAIVDANGIVLEGKWPSRIGRLKLSGEYEKEIEAAKKYRGYLHFFNREMLPKVTGRTLAMLTVTSGVAGAGGGAFYFQNDIERWLSGYLKHKEETEETAAEVHVPTKAKETESSDLKLQIQLAKEQQKLTEKQDRAAQTKLHLERYREQVRDELAQEGVRRFLEGAVLTWAGNTDTFARRLEDTGVMKDEERARQVLGVLQRKHTDELNRLEQEINKKPLIRNKEEWKYFDKYKEWPDKEDLKRGKPKSPPSIITPDSQADSAEAARRALHPEQPEWIERNKLSGLTGLDLITKMFEPEKEPDREATEDDIITEMAMELAKMISDISQSCKVVVESGMPDNSGYAELNAIVNEIVGFMKDVNEKSPEKVVKKGMDVSGPMSTQVDNGGGLFAERRRCRICRREINEKLLLECKKANCPMTYLSKITEKA